MKQISAQADFQFFELRLQRNLTILFEVTFKFMLELNHCFPRLIKKRSLSNHGLSYFIFERERELIERICSRASTNVNASRALFT